MVGKTEGTSPSTSVFNTTRNAEGTLNTKHPLFPSPSPPRPFCYSNPALKLVAGAFQLKLSKHTLFSGVKGNTAWLQLFFFLTFPHPSPLGPPINWGREGRREKALLNPNWQPDQGQTPRLLSVLLIKHQLQLLVWRADQALACPPFSPPDIHDVLTEPANLEVYLRNKFCTSKNVTFSF